MGQNYIYYHDLTDRLRHLQCILYYVAMLRDFSLMQNPLCIMLTTFRDVKARNNAVVTLKQTLTRPHILLRGHKTRTHLAI